MDSAAYSLIGAFGGVVITQLANYLLENKKANNLVRLKELDVTYHKNSELQKERREIYAKFLTQIDAYLAKNSGDLMILIDDYYKALIVSNEETSKEILNIFSMLKKKERETGKIIPAKLALLKAMREEI
ncbi:MAG: hypothetical protein WB444_01595 [Gallionella sp.]